MNDFATINCTVIDVRPVNKGRLIALATVEINIDGIVMTIDGVQVVRLPATANKQEMTGVDVPHYRGADGTWRRAVMLPDELDGPLGDAVLERCCELGITRRRYK